jgi:hypothetical protein
MPQIVIRGITLKGITRNFERPNFEDKKQRGPDYLAPDCFDSSLV